MVNFICLKKNGLEWKIEYFVLTCTSLMWKTFAMAPDSLLKSILFRLNIEKRYIYQVKSHYNGSKSEVRVMSSGTSDIMDKWFKSNINALYRFDNI